LHAAKSRHNRLLGRLAAVKTKRPIVELFGQHLPEFQFVGEKRPNLVFQHLQPNGIYRCIGVQRDGPSHGLAVQVAATYNAHWRGEPAYPLGIDTGLTNLRLRTDTFDVMQHWHFYEPTPAGLQRALAEIHRQFVEFVPPFFEHAERELLSRCLLQLALVEARNIPSAERVGLREAIDAVQGRVDRLEHPAFVRLRDRLRAAWSPDIPKEERQGTSRLAYDCLLFTSA
jgi:hypothetical protein